MIPSSPRDDEAWLEELILVLLRTPTGVPAGQTDIEPGDPAIKHAIDRVLLPYIESLQPDEIRRHPAGDVAARFGPSDTQGVLVQTYMVSQHGNLMDDPNAGRIMDGTPFGLTGRCAVGQGASQNKGPMACVLSALRQLPRQLSKPVWLAVNTEGRSSHGGSRRVIDDLEVKAAWGIVSIGTDLGVSLGNRGRVDVIVTVRGESCHSSQPWLGDNPIEGAADVVTALRSIPLPAAHPDLGSASVTPYQVTLHPVAPHTVPAEARVVVDRRVLPGEDMPGVVASLGAYLDRCITGELVIEEGVSMLPALVDRNSPLVSAIRKSVAEVTGRESSAFYSRNTFDAGYACSIGIPTCMFGPGKRSFSKGVTAAEVVALEDCRVATQTLQRSLVQLCS